MFSILFAIIAVRALLTRGKEDNVISFIAV